MACIYADENYDLGVILKLRQRGHEAGVSQDRATLTFNCRHFIRLHRTSQPQHGIIVCTTDPDVVALADRIHQALLSCTEGLTGVRFEESPPLIPKQ